jgi:hypothetical protein
LADETRKTVRGIDMHGMGMRSLQDAFILAIGHRYVIVLRTDLVAALICTNGYEIAADLDGLAIGHRFVIVPRTDAFSLECRKIRCFIFD